MKNLSLLLIFITITVIQLHAQHGSLDFLYDIGAGPNSNPINDMAVQNNDKAIIVGDFTTLLGTAISRNRIARLNIDGTLDTSFDPGTGANDIIRSVAIQNDGKIIIVGDFTSYDGIVRNRIARLNADGSLDNSFNPGTGFYGSSIYLRTLHLQSDGKIVVGGGLSLGYFNGSLIGSNIIRLNADGTLDSGFNSGTGPNDSNPGLGSNEGVWSISQQADGKLIVGGNFLEYNGFNSAGLVRVNTDGSFDPTFDVGYGVSSNTVKAIEIQNDGKILIGGSFSSYDLINNFMVARVNTNGSLDNSFITYTGPGMIGLNNSVNSINIQYDGKVILGGAFTDFSGTSRNSIIRLNSNGNLDNTFDPGTGASDYVTRTAIQSDGKVLICGAFYTYNGTTKKQIARLINCAPISTSQTIVECLGYSITVGSNTYTTTGIYTDAFTGVYGCDSTVITNLTINQPSSATDIQTACTSYTWVDGNTYTASNNTATWTGTNINGCDSIVTLDLTINQSNITDVQTACGTYTWVDGNTYTSNNNTATWTGTNIYGCDSIVTLNLTINPTPDINVSQLGSTLTSNQTSANYQWIDCNDNNSIINGETNQSYTPTMSGNYAVEVILNGCTDTSNCFLIDDVGLSELYSDVISIYPNPASDYLTIKGLNKVKSLKGIEITTLIGETVFQIENMNGEIDISKLSSGLYFLNIIHEKGIETIRFVKQ